MHNVCASAEGTALTLGAVLWFHQPVRSPHNNRVVLLHLGEKEITILPINHTFKASLHLLMQYDEN